jgi:hypothetical protein
MLLTDTGIKINIKMIEQLNWFCMQCQKHSQAPRCFKFKLKDNYEFNYRIIVDIIYVRSKNNKKTIAFHVIDETIGFQAARFLDRISATDVWEVLRLNWIDVYQGPPDWIVYNTST